MTQTQTGETIVREITIQASATRIFEALTDPVQRVKWWGAGYIEDAAMESDLRPGGKWLMTGIVRDKPFRISGEYREIEPPTVLTFTMLATWMPNPCETLVRFSLEERAGTTLVRLTQSGVTAENVQYFSGWSEILGGLQIHVERAETSVNALTE